MRKFCFAYLASAIVVFPGGFGTCDELFEILTLAQTDKLSKRTDVILYGREYWDQIFTFEPMEEWGAIATRDLELLHHADTPIEAFEHLPHHLVRQQLQAEKKEAGGAGFAKEKGGGEAEAEGRGHRAEGRAGEIMTSDERARLVARYKDGYRVVAD